MKLSIVILSYNTEKLTLECLKSVVSQYKDELEKKELEVIVIDNNSSDDSVKTIKSYMSDIKQDGLIVISNKKNLGFGKGNNLGAKIAKGKNILFLNSDTEVLDKALVLMADYLDKNRSIGVLGGRLENKDGSVQKSCGKFYTLFNLFIMLLGFERLGFLRSSPDKVQDVDWVSGACLMVRKDIFNKLSGFDENIFMYTEDMEICYRVKMLGFSTCFYPDLKLIHKSLGSSNKAFAIINIYKGILYFYKKHRTNFEYLIARILLNLKAATLIIVGFLTLNSGLRNRYQKAIS